MRIPEIVLNKKKLILSYITCRVVLPRYRKFISYIVAVVYIMAVIYIVLTGYIA